MAGINQVATRSDLLDRALIFRLPPLDPRHRREERELWHAFEVRLPYIFGGLLDALVTTLPVAPELHLPRLPRMADFARMGAAAAKGLGRTPEDFLQAYERNIARQHQSVVECNPVARAVLGFMEQRDKWDGTYTKLLCALTEDAGRNPDGIIELPRNPDWLSRKVHEITSNLRALGIRLTERPTNTGTVITLLKDPSLNRALVVDDAAEEEDHVPAS
ncbi:MAG: hypothetical protein ACYDBB_16295 [Armatimonadota bacterium]